MTVQIPFDNSYARLPDRFFARLAPTPVAAPRLVAVNGALAQELGLDAAALASPEGVQVLAGNRVPEGADPLAQAYAGHQFGGWVPQLGDGRAILLGEISDRNGIRRDIQLKGSGRTPFSRGGDGRAWLGPVIREYIVSEAMHALGIPTTRALAAVTTGEQVLREAALPGAVLTRVAASHIRVGTFQFFAARRDTEALAALAAHVAARHYPGTVDALALLDAVVARQAALIAAWVSVGFIHGVMNTDNAQVAGETIDYGPCAFMDAYSPDKVFSSIDSYGRYAYNQQPAVAAWNMAQFASALLPLMGEVTDAAITAATASVNRFAGLYEAAWLARFRAKLGLTRAEDGDRALIDDLLALMAVAGADFTNTFRGLGEGTASAGLAGSSGFDTWHDRWTARLAREGATPADRSKALSAANPALIPRNHRVEQAIQAAVAGDLGPFERLNAALAHPFDPAPGSDDLRKPPEAAEEVRQTFCGT